MAKIGRHPKYTPERVKRICDAIERGETNETAARIGGIAVGTFCRWMDEKSDFREAVKRAKAAYEDWRMNGILEDARKSLKTLVCGQEYEEVKTEYENDGVGKPRIKKQIRITKKVLPNATAVIFALCNTDPEHWRQRVEQDVRADVKTTEEPQPNKLAKVPTELLRQLCDAMDK